MSEAVNLRPILPKDAEELAELFALSIELLTQNEYSEEQRLAWMSAAVDEKEFYGKLAKQLTILAEVDGEIAGFASLTESAIGMCYVHPEHAFLGVGTALLDALEKLAKARKVDKLFVDSSDTAVEFFKKRGFEAQSRNTIVRLEVTLPNTTMIKSLSGQDEPARVEH